MKPITDREFKKAFADYQKSMGTSYKSLDAYTHSHAKMRFKCPTHGIFEKTFRGLLGSLGCPSCVKEESARRSSEKRTAAYKKKLGSNIELLSAEHLTNVRLEHLCKVCDTKFLSLPATVLSKGCPNCANRAVPKTGIRHTEETFQRALREAQPNIALCRNTFEALYKSAKFKCPTHGYFSVTARSALDRGCQKCNREAQTEKAKLNKKIWEARIKETHGTKVRLLGAYKGCSDNRKYRFKCYVCFNTWKAQLHHVGVYGGGCPYCANKRKSSQRSKSSFAVKTFERDNVVFNVQGWEFQAICWLLDRRNVQAHEILTESSGEIPTFEYKLGRRSRNYYPDLYVPKWYKIIEVKSNYTLGLAGGRKASYTWRTNQAKAKAVLAAGYKYSMMLMAKDGTRCMLPKKWYEMSMLEVLTWIAFHNGDVMPTGVKSCRKFLPETQMCELRSAVQSEEKRRKHSTKVRT